MVAGLQTPSKELVEKVTNDAHEAHKKCLKHANTAAMTAGVFAGRRGASLTECPFDDEEMKKQWVFGVKLAQKAAQERRERQSNDLDLFRQKHPCRSHSQAENSFQ